MEKLEIITGKDFGDSILKGRENFNGIKVREGTVFSKEDIKKITKTISRIIKEEKSEIEKNCRDWNCYYGRNDVERYRFWEAWESLPISEMLVSINLEGLCFNKVKAKGLFLRSVCAKGVCFKDSDFEGAKFYDVDFEGANFEGANLEGVVFSSANLKKVNFKNSNCSDARFYSNRVWGKDYSRKFLLYLDGANFKGATLHKTVFEHPSLKGTDFRGVDLTSVDFKRDFRPYEDFQPLKDALINGAKLTTEQYHLYSKVVINVNREVKNAKKRIKKKLGLRISKESKSD